MISVRSQKATSSGSRTTASRRSIATLAGAAIGLLEALLEDDHEIVTIIEGEGATPASTRAITEWVAQEHEDLTAEVLHGGQPLYPYLLGIE